MEIDIEICKKVYQGLLKDFDKICVRIINNCTDFNESLLGFIKEYRKYGILAFGHTQFINDACFFFEDKVREEAIKAMEKIIIYVVTEEVNNEKR